MSDATGGALPRRPRIKGWRNRLIASPKFQNWAARFPLTRGLVRKDGEALFDLVAGFCYSQVLQAIVELDLPSHLMDGPVEVAVLGRRAGIPDDRMTVLVRAGVALGLLKETRGRVALTRQGAALQGAPGLKQMIRHHAILYRDLADPVAFFRGETETELADFWPYVFGADGDPETAATYSQLMADSQGLVAEDTLATVSLKGVERLLDIGGGTGAFLAAAGSKYTALKLDLFDLPSVIAGARQRFAETGQTDRATLHPGSFREDPLPQGADAISLVRVLYDHSDATVQALLAKVHAALPEGGRLIISEPMLGAKAPERPGDAYFALYTLAMRTGRTRSAPEIAAHLADVGFGQITCHKSRRPFVTSVVTAVKSA